MRTSERTARRLAGCWVLGVLILSGCGHSGSVGKVTGKVRYKDQLLSSGTVTFVGADGKVQHGAIAADGTYRIARVAVGTARVAVLSHSRAPAGLGDGQEKPVAIPKRYERPETSGLTYEVKKGRQSFDIDLILER
jgi:hypothetical protein